MESLIKRIKQHEGFSYTSYPDAGAWAIGYGHRQSTQEPREITQHNAEQLLLLDVYRASDCFMRWKWQHCSKLDLVRSEALVELIYWVGFTGFLRFTRMIEALQNYDYKLAALELYHSQLGEKYSERAKDLSVLLWEG